MSQTQFSSMPPLPLNYSSAAGRADEVFNEDGVAKPHWQQLLKSLQTMGSGTLAERHDKASRILRDDGATYNIYGETKNPSRTWGLDLVPAVIGSEEWAVIESGLLERAELLNAFLKDIYGPRELVRRGVIPPEAIFAHGGFLRACHGIQTGGEHELILHAVDMVRTDDGSMCVLTDRTQAPSGMGYALENRTVMSRVLPSLFRDSHAHRLAPFFQRLRTKLASLSSAHDQPRVVVLTPGAHNETYFEHAYLANYLGFQLVQSGDLVVRNGFVWMKSLDGLSRVDVILRRVDDWYCDPVELRSDSQLGVPHLLEAVRAGRVIIANPLGAGILENPVFLKFMPAIAKALLGREPRLASVATYWCGQEDDMAYVMSHLNELVIKPTLRSNGPSSVHAANLTEAKRKELIARIKAHPWQYVAQSRLVASHLPTFVGGNLQPRPSILRSFAVASDTSYSIMPGGLTRVGTDEGAFLISGQVGAQSKDTWVISSEPEVSPAEGAGTDAVIASNEAQLISLPSRVVENLFWMGRYAERAEATLRILRTAFILLNGEDPVSESSRGYLLAAVTDVTGTLPGFKNCSAEMLANPEAELLRLAKDPNMFGSVHYNLTAMLRSADESKELLSSDTMRVINDIRDALDNLETNLSGSDGSAPEEALDPLVTALMALAGLTHESMVRGIGWHFIEIGRRTERGVQTLKILEGLLIDVMPEHDQNTLLEALLLSVETLIRYRRRYRARMSVRQVLEVTMLDATNPRSVRFQFDRLKKYINGLPRVKPTNAELSTEEKSILEADTRIRLADLSLLCERDASDKTRPQLKAMLAQLQKSLADISTIVSDKYFDHKVGPQQLVRRNWEE